MPSPTDRPTGQNDNGPGNNQRNAFDSLSPGNNAPFDSLLSKLSSPSFNDIRLEVELQRAVSSFVADYAAGSRDINPDEHPSLETISKYLGDSAVENYVDLPERFHTFSRILEESIPNETDDREVANGVFEALCCRALSDVGSCFASQSLSLALERYEERLQELSIDTVCNATSTTAERLKELLISLDRHEDETQRSFPSLINEAIVGNKEIVGLKKVAPDISEEFSELLKGQLLGAYRHDFNRMITDKAQEQRALIEAALSRAELIKHDYYSSTKHEDFCQN